MSRQSRGNSDNDSAKQRLTLVVSARLDETESAGEGGKDDRSTAVIARKALYRQTGLLEIRIDDARKRQAISDALRAWGIKPERPNTKKRALVVASVVVVLVGSIVPMYLASRSSLPGDPLWHLKRAGESVRQWFARGAPAEARAALSSTGERLNEARKLAGDERYDAARDALDVFYREFDGARRRLRAVPKETHPELYDEADRQLRDAAALDELLNGEAAHSTAPRGPEAIGTLSPTPRPPWEPENPQENRG
jgi:hypothetical protein